MPLDRIQKKLRPESRAPADAPIDQHGTGRRVRCAVCPPPIVVALPERLMRPRVTQLQRLSRVTILACAFLLPAAQCANADEFARAKTLAADARVASDRKVPILLFFSQAGCGFCERARREYLRPLAQSGAWATRALMREVPIEATLTGFDGKRVSGRDLAQVYGIRVFPTVVFVDAGGNLIAEPLAGFTVPDFYAAYLDQRLDAASARLARP